VMPGEGALVGMRINAVETVVIVEVAPMFTNDWRPMHESTVLVIVDNVAQVDENPNWSDV
jgi:hypothetical protein